MSIYGHLLEESNINISAEDIKSAIKNAIEKVKKWFKSLISNIKQLLLNKIPAKFKIKLQNLLNKIKDHSEKADNITATSSELENLVKLYSSDAEELKTTIEEIKDDKSIDDSLKKTAISYIDKLDKISYETDKINRETDEKLKRLKSVSDGISF